MSEKVFAVYAPAGCGGCSQSLLSADNFTLLLDRARIAFWATEPGDLTQAEIEGLEDRSIDVLFYIGPVLGEREESYAKLLRRRANRVVAYGACAHLGGLCGLANLTPGARLRTVPSLDGRFVQPLPAVIDVDYILPGCPPPAGMIERMIEVLFDSDEIPEPGTVFASSKGVCAECNRRRLNRPLNEISRFHLKEPDPDICFLDQGIICLGPVTRGGCGAVCIEANRPCTGCAGPLAGVRDQGGAIIQSLASLVRFSGEGREKKEKELLDSIPDPVGTAYRFSVASSALKGRLKDAD